jgi:hypothetical protein
MCLPNSAGRLDMAKSMTAGSWALRVSRRRKLCCALSSCF